MEFFLLRVGVKVSSSSGKHGSALLDWLFMELFLLSVGVKAGSSSGKYGSA